MQRRVLEAVLYLLNLRGKLLAVVKHVTDRVPKGSMFRGFAIRIFSIHLPSKWHSMLGSTHVM